MIKIYIYTHKYKVINNSRVFFVFLKVVKLLIKQSLFTDSVKQTQLRNTQESNCTKSEKENLESRDEDVKTCAFRKREREVMLTSNDEEKYENKSTAKKLTKLHSRFCLSEAKNNNETFAWDEENSHAKSQSQKKQSRVTRAKNRSTFAKKSVRLKSKTS